MHPIRSRFLRACLLTTCFSLSFLGSQNTLAQSCVTASAGDPWRNFALATQSGSFTVQFDATPSASPANSVVALSRGAQTDYPGFAALARFSPSGTIDARDGGAYAAAATIPYSAGLTYHFRIAVDLMARTYSVLVTPPGAVEQLVGSNFTFRTEQNTVSMVDSWAVFENAAPAGSLTVCNFALQTSPSQPDFSLAATPASQTVTAGASTTYSSMVGAINGFGQGVTLIATGMPSSATAVFNPSTVSGSGTSILTVTTSSTTPVGTSVLTVAGVSGGQSHTTKVMLTVNASGQRFNVKSFGAKGNGTTVDSPAINNAIIAANSAGGGIVEFPAGRYLSKSIHLKSNVTLQLDSGATILANTNGFDAAEANSFSKFQDFGHSHFHDALIWGEHLQNIGFIGTGKIDGNGHLIHGNPSSGQADKAISLRECDGVTISDITIDRAGHLGILANGITHMTVARAHIITRDRDGFNLINSSHVNISDSEIFGSDDAMVLKSDFALGRKVSNTDIHVSNSTILSTQNNATQFGSETCGDFSNVSFDHITITAAGKAGIGITSNDGAIIDGVTYSNITMSGTTVPIWIKTGNRGSCPGSPPKGIIRNITISDVTAIHSRSSRGEFTNTISGLPGVLIENVSLTNVKLTLPGGHPESDTNVVPPETNNWQPSGQGTKPAFGWWLRHVKGITFNNCEVQFDTNDGRPAFIADDGQTLTLNGFVAERGSSSIFDLGFDTVNGFHVDSASQTTTGLPFRVHPVNSTPF